MWLSMKLSSTNVFFYNTYLYNFAKDLSESESKSICLLLEQAVALLGPLQPDLHLAENPVCRRRVH